MPLRIIRNDITRMEVDAIVNASNVRLDPGGGIDAAIHAAAGPKLLAACRKLGGCPVGEARMTRGYDLPAKHIIHTVGPLWQGGGEEEAQLASCYRSALRLAGRHWMKTVAFGLISSGRYGFPKETALRIATSTIEEFLKDHEMTVYLVVYDEESYGISKQLYHDIESFLHGKTPKAPKLRRQVRELPLAEMALPMACQPGFSAPSLTDKLKTLDEGFSAAVLRLIDEKGMTDVECYKKANLDRKLFSKLRSGKGYKPSKATAVALAIALELDLRETEALLRKAGYALSHSSKFDLIIEYFIENRIYNVFEINEALFAFDQNLLGA